MVMTWSICTFRSLPGICSRRPPSFQPMTDALALDTLVLDPRFNGPPGTANGGYAAGSINER